MTSQVYPDTSSTCTTSTVRELLSSSIHNEVEIIPAPEQYINSLNTDILNRLETIPVTPEAPWDRAGEVLLRHWMDEAKNLSKEHRTTAYRLKSLYRKLSILNIFATGLVFLVSSLFPCTTQELYKAIHVFVSFISLLVANTSSFYDFGPKYQHHFQYEALYSKYTIDIREILATESEFRPPKDKTITEFRERMGSLLTSAPET